MGTAGGVTSTLGLSILQNLMGSPFLDSKTHKCIAGLLSSFLLFLSVGEGTFLNVYF